MPEDYFIRRARIEAEPLAPARPRRLLSPVYLSPRWHAPRRRARVAEIEPEARPRTRPNAAAAHLLFSREITLAQELHAFARPGLRVFALNLETDVETELGFVTSSASQYLADIALDDGVYELRVRADGHYWRDARFLSVARVTILDGEIATQLPAILNLAYLIQAGTVYLSWSWEIPTGTTSPAEFAIWTSATDPADVSGAPDYIIPAIAPGAVTTIIAGTLDTQYVSVRTRRDTFLGAVSSIAIVPPDVAIDSPDNQSARYVPE